MKILIAEDNPLWRASLESQVRSWGYEPVLAENGQHAWDVLQRTDAPRLAILDWQMPEMDGIEVCRKVKQCNQLPFTYVVMLTSRDAEEDMVAGLNAGADDYLTKPVEPPVLKSRLTAARRIVELVPPKEWSMPRLEGYQVKEMIGKGAFATVWKAIRDATGELVAVKIIRIDLATEEVFNRFAREIRLTEKLDHRNIAAIRDSRIDQQLAYFAMEYIDGPSLDGYVKDQHPKAAKILRLLAEVCDGLHHAHQAGIVHRDLKPSNVMVAPGGHPKLVDFGLARSMFSIDSESEIASSMEGSVIGTPLFMAPEQARGENESLDGRADVYAVGIILYLLLLRRHPHEIDKRDRWATLREIAEGNVRRPRDVQPNFSRELEGILLKSLADNPDNRYQTALEFGEALRMYVEQRAQSSRKKPT